MGWPRLSEIGAIFFNLRWQTFLGKMERFRTKKNVDLYTNSHGAQSSIQ